MIKSLNNQVKLLTILLINICNKKHLKQEKKKLSISKSPKFIKIQNKIEKYIEQPIQQKNQSKTPK